MKMKALVMESPAPVAKVYVPQSSIVRMERMRTAAGEFPANARLLLIIMYIMPRCSPDRASICEAPLERNDSAVSAERLLRSPVRSAFMTAFVPESEKAIVSIWSPMAAPMDASLAVTAPSASGLHAALICPVIPVNRPHVNDMKHTNMGAYPAYCVFPDVIIRHAMNATAAYNADDANMLSVTAGTSAAYAAAMTPAANGNENHAISLSTFISFLFFAKVAIIFITLRSLCGFFAKF